MEHEEEIVSEAFQKLRDFQNEMRREKEWEAAHGRANLLNVDASELNDADRAIWEKAKSGSIDTPDLTAHAAALIDEKGIVREGVPQGRLNFLAFIRNKATIIFGRRELKKLGIEIPEEQRED